MPILKMDRFGNVYESNPDRHDGTGVGAIPRQVTRGDTFFGDAGEKSGRGTNFSDR